MSIEFILETERLHLRPFLTTDLELFQHINIDPFVRKFLWDDVSIDRNTAQDLLQKNESQFKSDQYGLWKVGLKNTNTVIGYTGFWHFFDEEQPQLIYALLEKYTGKGFATEFSKAMIKYAFKHLGFDYLVAATDEAHVASQKVAQRLGMKFFERRIEDNKPTLFYKIDRHHNIYQ